MRVVAGFLKGRNLQTVPGLSTRPTADKVKESVFNALGQFFTGGTALDLFAGSGSLGIEAVSRGMDFCYFVDRDLNAAAVIKENLKMLKIEAKAKVIKGLAMKALDTFVQEELQFNLVLLDPPYKEQNIIEIIKQLEQKNLLSEAAVIVCETLKEDSLESDYKTVVLFREYTYGITKITIFKKDGEISG